MNRSLSPSSVDTRALFQRRDLLGLGLGLGALASACAPVPLARSEPAAVPRFAHGVASGQPLPDRIVLWTRLTGADLAAQVEVQWELATDEGMRHIVASGTEWAEAAWSHSVHAEPAGLAPGRWYWYRFTALGQRSVTGRTRTAPAAGAMEPLRFVTASCQRWDHGHYAAWRHVVEESPDLVIFLGDYIYESAAVPGRIRLHEGGACRTLADYRARYAQYRSDPLLQAAHAAAPWIMVWDDHEVENDYAGLQGEHLQTDFAAQRAAAYRAYWEYLPFPKALRPSGADMRITGHFDWGQLGRILCVDDRQYRDPQACPKPGRGGSTTVKQGDCPALEDPRRSLLGMAQEDWLARTWSSSHRWNLLAQQTLMARAVQPNFDDPRQNRVWTDGWDGYAPARKRLLQTVLDRRVPGCVVLSGDVHASYVADLKPDYLAAGSPRVATEFCGTSISSHSWPQARTDALLEVYPHLRYGRADERGYLSFQLDAKALQVQIRSVIDPNQVDSGIRTAARFAVEAGRPGAQRA